MVVNSHSGASERIIYWFGEKFSPTGSGTERSLCGTHNTPKRLMPLVECPRIPLSSRVSFRISRYFREITTKSSRNSKRSSTRDALRILQEILQVTNAAFFFKNFTPTSSLQSFILKLLNKLLWNYPKYLSLIFFRFPFRNPSRNISLLITSPFQEFLLRFH